MKLAAYMEMAGLKDDELAETLGLERSTVTKLRLGKSVPSFGILIKIQKLSDNAVTANDFLEASAA